MGLCVSTEGIINEYMIDTTLQIPPNVIALTATSRIGVHEGVEGGMLWVWGDFLQFFAI